MENEKNKLSYDNLKRSILPIISSWESGERAKVDARRRLRRDDVDVNSMRTAGQLGPDDTYIPQRIIDRRIKEELASQLTFLQSPDRILVFTDIEDRNNHETELLENAFTQYMRYPGWIVPWLQIFDAVDLHGGCGIEVRFDITKPLHCSIEYIQREDLMFPDEATSIQGCEHIIRKYSYMPFEIESFIESFNFNEKEVKNILDNYTGQRRHEKINVYRVFTKCEDIVYTWWYTNKCNDFLKSPEPLKLGLYDIDEALNFRNITEAIKTGQLPPDTAVQMPEQLPVRDYPIFWLPYEIIEDTRLLASKGRAFRDAADQEAQTSLWSSIINGANKASQVYSAYVNNPVMPEGISESKPLKGNTIIPREVRFFSPQFPSGELLAIATQASVNSAALNSRIDFAVNNRRDSRKTAREVIAAQEQQNIMMNAAIAGQSPIILSVYELCWRIGQSQVVIGAIENFPVDYTKVARVYKLSMAGDTDIILREKKKQVITETFQYFAGSPISNLFLSYLIETYFPEKASEWVPAVMAGDPTDLIAKASYLLKASAGSSNISPQEKTQLMQFVSLLDSYVNARYGTTARAEPDSGGGVQDVPSGADEQPADAGDTQSSK